MNKLFLIALIGAVLVSACIASTQTASGEQQGYIKREVVDYNDGQILTFCKDKVVCYETSSTSYGSAGSCFRDADLVEKYCGDING